MPRLRKPPQEDKEPEVVENAATDDGGRVIELPEDGTEGVTVQLAPEPETPAPAPELPAEDNPVQKAADAAKRAEELVRQNAQLVRERNAAIAKARELGGEVSRERNDRLQAEYDSVLNAIGGQQAAAEKAQTDYEAALAAQDYKAASEAQRRLSRAEANLVGLEDRKAFLDRKPEPQPQAQTPAPSTDEMISRIPNSDAQAWLRKHPEFVTDQAKNNQIGAVHNYLVNVKRIPEWTPEYFEALDTEFGFRAAPQPAPQLQQQQPQHRSIPVAAPVSRDVPTANGQRQSSRQIHLTREEVQIAHASRRDLVEQGKAAEAEKLYAQNKAKLQRMKANGEYRQTTEQNG